MSQSGSSRLAPSTRLGPYEVLAAVGAGGMGEVYSAKDTRLDRTVAIKLLPPHLARDEQLRARFEREAKTVSSLNPPHIDARSLQIKTAPAFEADAPQPLFSARFANVNARAHYRPTPDGQRFLVLAPLRQETIPPTTVVLNWTAGMR